MRNSGIIVNRRTQAQASEIGKVAIHDDTAGLPMYDQAPGHTITLDEFRQVALDRLQYLKQLEQS